MCAMLLFRPEEMAQIPENYSEKLYSFLNLFLHKLNLT